TVQFGALPRSRALVPARFSRLIRHSTTIDPYLDESGPSARRLGALALDGVSYDALDLSTTMELRADIRTSAGAVLRVPCAATGRAPRGVTFEVVVAAPGAAERRRRVRVAGDGLGRWHVLALRVPQGSLALTVRASTDGDAAAAGAVCGVPSLTWLKSPRAVSRSIAFAVRTLGLSGAVRHLRTKGDAYSAAQYYERRPGSPPNGCGPTRARRPRSRPRAPAECCCRCGRGSRSSSRRRPAAIPPPCRPRWCRLRRRCTTTGKCIAPTPPTRATPQWRPRQPPSSARFAPATSCRPSRCCAPPRPAPPTRAWAA